jgi:ubiquitin-like modifier-activating enzyme ATG7
METGEWE